MGRARHISSSSNRICYVVEVVIVFSRPSVVSHLDVSRHKLVKCINNSKSPASIRIAHLSGGLTRLPLVEFLCPVLYT